MVLLIFPAILSMDLYRREDRRLDIFCCFTRWECGIDWCFSFHFSLQWRQICLHMYFSCHNENAPCVISAFYTHLGADIVWHFNVKERKHFTKFVFKGVVRTGSWSQARTISDSVIVSVDDPMCLNFGALILRNTGQSDLPFILLSKGAPNVYQNLGLFTYEKIHGMRACFV